jgi:hypothetical protein
MEDRRWRIAKSVASAIFHLRSSILDSLSLSKRPTGCFTSAMTDSLELHPQLNLSPDDETALQEMLGYLNFSNGKPDPRFQANLNRICSLLKSDLPVPGLRALLGRKLETLRETSPAFKNCDQAAVVVTITLGTILPAYRQHHADLLFHLPEADFHQPFLLARMFEAVLAQGPPWDETERITNDVLHQLNDFLGHRPVAVLENGRQMEPYPHERFRPVPLFLRGAGVAIGRYHDLIAKSLEIFTTTPADVMRDAYFDPNQMEELALDVRAFDPNHPVYKRTNYTFGEWDPHCIDLKGRYRRFVVRQIILESLLSWMAQAKDVPPDEALYEAASVLCGTMLMASSVSGSGPDTHDSTVSLTNLLPKIARQRDEFYTRLLNSLSGSLAKRLKSESEAAQQPFGKIRQHLNLHLADHGCRQLQHGYLALLFARMGYPDASQQHASVIPSTAARFETEIQWRVSAAHIQLDQERIEDAAKFVPEIEDLLKRGIECGALVDPWNILGFQGQFPLFHTREDSIADTRIDRLLSLMEQTFGLSSRLLGEAAASGNRELDQKLSERFRALAEQWDHYATTTVSDLPTVSGMESFESARQVADALFEWSRAGEAAGDVAFWRQHVVNFQSTKAFAMVVEALLQKRDIVAAMSLLIHWLSQNEFVPLELGTHSFHSLSERWLNLALGIADRQRSAAARFGASGADPRSFVVTTEDSEPAEEESSPPAAPPTRSFNSDVWPMAKKFFDYIEVNASDFWHVPTLDDGLGSDAEPRDEGRHEPGAEKLSEPDDESSLGLTDSAEEDSGDLDDLGDDLYQAAYDNVTYRDSADDGQFGSIMDTGGPASDSDIDRVARRLDHRLRFLATLAQLWKTTAEVFVSRIAAPSPTIPLPRRGEGKTKPRGEPVASPEADAVLADQVDHFARWFHRLEALRRDLNRLITAVAAMEIPEPSGETDSLNDYDRQVYEKFSLLNQVLHTVCACQEASRSILCALPADAAKSQKLPAWEQAVSRLNRHILLADADVVRRDLPGILKELSKHPLLYTPLDKGGQPRDVLAVRNLHAVLRFLLTELPRLGLLRETWHVLRTAYIMERSSNPGSVAITEFDRLFQIALRNSIEVLVRSAGGWFGGKFPREQLIELVGNVTELYLKLWLKHSSTMRLTSVEALKDAEIWREVKQFIKTYGGDLLQAHLLNLGNLRAILHHGVPQYLNYLLENQDPVQSTKLLESLGQVIEMEDAAELLELIFRILVEKFDRFMEYNTTTTQSDYGEQLYILLDFLKLESSYERQAWNLSPLVIAHEVLAREGLPDAARLWQDVLQRKTHQLAEQHVHKLKRLEKVHGIRLPGITDRLNERFVKPLVLDRILAMIEPVMNASRAGRDASAFQSLRPEIEKYLETSSGAAFDVHPWLQALEEEVQRVEAAWKGRFDPDFSPSLRPFTPLDINSLRQQLGQWEKPLLPEE